MSRSVIQGAPNFRHISDYNVFAVAQPTLAGMNNVLSAVLSSSSAKDFVWINLREEPIIYINGSPYVLRDNYYTLRNIKAYSGITESRLELLEKRLKEDILKEILMYDGKILLHEEQDGVVKAVWTIVLPQNVLTLKEVVDSIRDNLDGVSLYSYRVPITAEAAPEPADFDQLIQIIGRYDLRSTSLIM
jgi:hypothetical protein